MRNPMDLSGKRILITGASSGIGRASAILASHMGSSVVLLARHEENLNQTLALMEPGDHLVVPFDLSNLDGIAQLPGMLHAAEKKLDGIVHCAGTSAVLPIAVTTPKLTREMMTVNCLSFIELVRTLVKKRYFSENGGSIVGVSSTASLAAWVGGTAYCASKGALDSAVRVLALEMARKRVRVNTVCPGATKTPMLDVRQDVSDVSREDLVAQTQPLGMCTPEDIANAIVFLLGDASRMITGIHLLVDGGYLAQ